MSNMVTRCPKCATSFRITSAQLQSAKGAVRCGSCLHIFKAQDHLLSGEAPAPTPPLVTKAATSTNQQSGSPRPAASPVTPAPQSPAPSTPATSVSAAGLAPSPSMASRTAQLDTTADTLLFNQSEIDREIVAFGDDDDLLISDDMDQAAKDEDEFIVDEFLNMDAQPRQSTSLFERRARDIEVEEQDDADESWAESLLEQADDEAQFDQVKRQITSAENGSADATFSEEDAAIFDYAGQTPPPYNIDSRDPIFSLVGEDSEAENNLKEIFTEKELSEEIRAVNREESPLRSDTAAPDIPMRAYDTSRAALLMNIMPEPVVMTSRRKRSWYQRKLWTLLSLLMFVLLVVQVAWLQFDNLSRIHPYRAAYEFICPALGCTVPTLVDRSKIRVRNLLVRKHPDIADALIMDVIILNNAPFEQPFPDLVMAFSDIENRPVAARRFTPREYLAGELAGMKLMPQNQPVHISMELVDPGEAAVNYKIEPY